MGAKSKPAHAILSASSSHRWLNCPPSALLCADREDMGSSFAREGTDAHALCEYKVRRLLGENAESPVENLTYYDAEMEECAEDYAAYISELIADAKKHCSDPIILVEQRLDFSEYVPDGFGTGDCVVVADDTLEIVDFKYGKGVEVSAVNNPQMMLYALGALTLFDSLYDITQVSMTIFQPRLNNLSNSIISKSELLEWAANTLKPAAARAAKGDGEFRSGDCCRFCKVKAECRKRAEANLELAKLDFAQPATLGNTEIADILKKADSLAAWAADIKEYALNQAKKGVKFDGFKLVEGKSNRKYLDEAAAAKLVEAAGFDPYDKTIKGITSMEKLLGKKRFLEILSEYVVKPKGKPTLVPDTDKRLAINAAAEDFKEG